MVKLVLSWEVDHLFSRTMSDLCSVFCCPIWYYNILYVFLTCCPIVDVIFVFIELFMMSCRGQVVVAVVHGHHGCCIPHTELQTRATPIPCPNTKPQLTSHHSHMNKKKIYTWLNICVLLIQYCMLCTMYISGLRGFQWQISARGLHPYITLRHPLVWLRTALMRLPKV